MNQDFFVVNKKRHLKDLPNKLAQHYYTKWTSDKKDKNGNPLIGLSRTNNDRFSERENERVCLIVTNEELYSEVMSLVKDFSYGGASKEIY